MLDVNAFRQRLLPEDAIWPVRSELADRRLGGPRPRDGRAVGVAPPRVTDVMRSGFEEYYTPTDAEIKRLWAEAWFVFDTNALLAFYRNSARVVDEAFTVIRAVRKRLWLPHQVALEYHKALPAVEAALFAAPDDTLKAVEVALSRLRQEIAEKRHPYLREAVLKQVEGFEVLTKRLIARKDISDPKTLTNHISEIRTSIDELFLNIGPAYADRDLEHIYSEGKSRYERRISPGFADEKSKTLSPVQKYGDLIVWKQMLNQARTTSHPIIFITNDKKDDWWLIHSGKTIGPHPQLREEMRREAKQEYYAYTLEQFVEHGVPEIVNRDLKKDAAEDAKLAERAEQAAQLDEAYKAKLYETFASQMININTRDNAFVARLNGADIANAGIDNTLNALPSGLAAYFQQFAHEDINAANSLDAAARISSAPSSADIDAIGKYVKGLSKKKPEPKEGQQ